MKPNQLELMQEANRRGILPADKKPLYDEAIRRGLIKDESQPEMSMGEAAFTTATNPLGFGDEIKAGISAGVAKLFGGAATQDIDIGDLYREARTSERAKLDKARQDYPSMTGMIETPSNLARGAVKGLEEVGSGMYQTAADFGADFSGAKAILSKIRPDLKNEIESLTPQDISSILGEKAAQDSKATEQEGLAYKTGRFAGKVAPFLGVGGGSATGLAVGGGLAGGSELMEDSSAGKRLGSAAVGAAVAPVVGKVIEEAIPAAQALGSSISQAPKKLLQKITGIDSKAVKTFQDLGIDPTLADVSKSAGLQNFIKDIPVAGKPITEALQKQVNDISGQIQNVVKASAKNPKQMGSQIQKGAQEFKTLANARVSTLYDDLDKFLPEETVIPTNNVLNLTKDPQIQDVVAVGTGDTAKILNRYSNIVDDAGNISYPRLKTFRSVVGAKLDSPMLLGDERAALKRIYGSLSEDMKQAVVNNGGDKALQAFNKANSAFERKINFLEKNIDPIIKAKTPEKVYKLAISGIKDGGTQTKRLMNILKPEQQEYVRASIARDMGLARKGAQSAEANVFDPQKFMAEYSVLKKNGTEKAIFTPEQVTAYNRLNKVVELTKNTEQAGKSNMLLPIASLLSVGIPTAGAGLIPAIGGGRLTANLMTNPKFINWLAVTSQATPKQLPKQLNRLSAITAANPEIREDVLDFVANFGNNNQQENTTE
jgi:hypothetical protein